MKNSEEQETNQDLTKTLNELEQTIEDLRIMVKYQAFDLEATRRENEYFQKLLEEKDKK